MGLGIELSVGPQAVAAQDGASIESRGGRTGDQVVTQLNPRYFEQMVRGRVFTAANTAAQAVSVALATTYTGLLLYNPLGSGKVLVPIKWKYALSVAPAAIATIGLIRGYAATGGVTAQTTAITVASGQVGNTAVGVGVALSAATIVTPTWAYQLYDGFTAAALPAPQVPVDLEGLFGIYPGGFMGAGALTAVTGLGSVAWVEIDGITST